MAGDEALSDVRDDIIDDINQYVPVQGGKPQNGGGGGLQSSARMHSDQTAHKGKLTIRWDTPYAQYQNKGEVMKGRPVNLPVLMAGEAKIHQRSCESRMGKICRTKTWRRLGSCSGKRNRTKIGVMKWNRWKSLC